ncbi:hypothetical protein [Streptomyces sp. NPDC052225]|uniref:hypothetical protein n=1 Tax=Streptomyces sp. NPDC052225 TaxID=3154949 RepID=UPI0034466C9E
MTHEKRQHDSATGTGSGTGAGADSARTATESVLEEFEESQTDPRHRAEKDRRRGESGDAVTPNEEAQEQAHGE